jgi:hypothetical protein
MTATEFELLGEWEAELGGGYPELKRENGRIPGLKASQPRVGEGQ